MTDANDILRKAGRDKLRVVYDVEAARAALPEGFRYAANGDIEQLISEREDKGQVLQKWGFLCSPLTIEATTRDADQSGWGLLVRVKTPDGHWHRTSIARSALVGDGDAVLGELVDKGLRFVPLPRDKTALKRLLCSIQPKNRARCVPRVGWHGDVFVLPDEIIGTAEGEEIVFQPPFVVNHSFRQGGLYEGWQQEVAALAPGNSRLLFSLSAALSGPLLHLAEMSGGGWHWRGPSSVGKTTLLRAAGSVWGGGGLNGFIRSWKATANALESVAAIHTDTLLPLDELAEIDPREVGRVAYMLANGAGKARANRAGYVRPITEWRSSYISTGEISLGDKLSEDGRRATAGQSVRVIDLAADAGAGYGVFDSLSGFNRPADLADTLKEACETHYGHAGRKFIEKLVLDIDRAREDVRFHTAAFQAEHCPNGASGQASRVAKRFALVAAAGEMAQHFGIVPWPAGEAREACARLFGDWLRARGHTGNQEIEDGIDQVRRTIERDGSARFQPWGDLAKQVRDRLGFVKQADSLNDQQRTFYIYPNSWKEICSPYDAGAIAKAMIQRGLMEKDPEGRLNHNVRLPGSNKTTRVYVLDLDRLNDGDDG